MGRIVIGRPGAFCGVWHKKNPVSISWDSGFHFHGMDTIRNIDDDLPNDFSRRNFAFVEIIEENAIGGPVNKNYFTMTRDSIMILMMGDTGCFTISGAYSAGSQLLRYGLFRVPRLWNRSFLFGGQACCF